MKTKTIKPTTKNIVKIFDEVKRKLDKVKVPRSGLGAGEILTIYGYIKFSFVGKKIKIISGDKKAIKWLKTHIKKESIIENKNE